MIQLVDLKLVLVTVRKSSQDANISIENREKLRSFDMSGLSESNQ